MNIESKLFMFIIILQVILLGCGSINNSVNLPDYYAFEDNKIETYSYDFSSHESRQLDVIIDQSIYENVEKTDRVNYKEISIDILKKEIENTIKILETGKNSKTLYGDLVVIGSYISKKLNNTKFYYNYNALNFIKPLTINNQNVAIEEKIIRSKDCNECIEVFANFIRNEIIFSDFIIIRKANKNELDWYWTIINYDIEEPLFVIETQEHAFLLDFTEKDGIFYIDDLYFLNWKVD